MGLDDRNEGDGPDECSEHVWQLAGGSFDLGGALLDYKCRRCPAIMAAPPD